MRNVFTKLIAGTFVAGAALALAACGGSETAPAENTTELNATDAMASTNDLTAVDGALDNATDANAVAEDNASNAM